jgi:predicted SAM-dependent methyltransferase
MNYQYNKSTQNESHFINNYKNTICPFCGSKPRHRMLCYYFNTNNILPMHDKQSYKILMFGAEHSTKEWFKKNQFCYTTADLFDKSADIKVDIHKTPFSDESWHLIICNHVLQHVDNFSTALLELKRILKKEGLLVLTVATDNSRKTTYEDGNIEKDRRMEEYGQADYLRIFGRDFKEILENTGLGVEIVYGGILPSNIRAVVGPANHDDNRVYLCRKN